MPATEKTCRDQKLLHVVFAVSCVAMLLATVWMFAADHLREWKRHQREFRAVEIKYNGWRQDNQLQRQLQDQARLTKDWMTAQSESIDGGLLAQFQSEVKSNGDQKVSFAKIDRLAAELQKMAAESDQKIKAGDDDASAAQHSAIKSRAKVANELVKIIKSARYREETLLRQRKFTNGNLDAKKGALGIAVRDYHPESDNQNLKNLQKNLQQEIEVLKADVARLSLQYQDASSHRKELQRIFDQLNAKAVATREALDINEEALAKLEEAYRARRSTYFQWGYPLLGKKWLEMPILDAFGSPLKIETLWDDDNLINYNFTHVRRFDNCTTCHQAMRITKPGSAEEPSFSHRQVVDLLLPTPDADHLSEQKIDDQGNVLPLSLADLYGLHVEDGGPLVYDDVAISFVLNGGLGSQAKINLGPESKSELNGAEIRLAEALSMGQTDDDLDAAESGLMLGDLIEEIDGNAIANALQVRRMLLDRSRWGQSIPVRVRRGMPHPYATHPRFDLFVGDLSPHPLQTSKRTFGCTSCHDGQGPATAFKWASHTPNDPIQRKAWMRDYGWFDNHHWIFPQNPKRFFESGCLKCHHEVTELEPSERFPDPPAPKVVHGRNLIAKYGCFGCHEINGFDGPDKRVGPDMRSEPNFFGAALALRADPGFDKLTADEKASINRLIHRPDLDQPRHQIHQMLLDDTSRITEQTREKLIPLLADVSTPGQLRKTGPSLRFIKHKLDPEFLYDWIRDPQNFRPWNRDSDEGENRPGTRMPNLFGLWNHLEGGSLATSKKFEPVEILAISIYLLEYSQDQRDDGFRYLESTVDTPPSGERGKNLFDTRGCLACHTHDAFPEANGYRKPDEIAQGPDLSGVANKLVGANRAGNPNGRKWLYSWIKEPSRYHARTLMPNLFLEPTNYPITDDNGKQIVNDAGVPQEMRIDPAADIVEFLLSKSVTPWRPAEGTLTELDADTKSALEELARLNLIEAEYEKAADRHLVSGIPASRRGDFSGAEAELVVEPGEALTDRHKLLYVGRKAIAKHGCYGCHDIPGFEDAKPIGTALADWGRKETSKLAFGHILNYLEGHGHGHQPPQPEPFYLSALEASHRSGFIDQKLRAPRSYDYHDTENKKYSERLRMPQFDLSDEDREAIVTFVLGLVSEPPEEKFVYRPEPRDEAIQAGQQVLQKYNCGGCHVLELEKWQISYQKGDFSDPSLVAKFPFLKPHFTPEQLDASTQEDWRGRMQATLVGMGALSEDGLPSINDDEGFALDRRELYALDKLQYPFFLWEPVALAGNTFEVGGVALQINRDMIQSRRPLRGGMLARYLVPKVVAMNQQLTGIPGKRDEPLGWVPPPLHGEGNKVRSDWLHDFLLDPYRIRPAVVLRMPRFNMSSDEAAKLVNYFAAVDNADYPYSHSERRPIDLARAESAYAELVAGAGDSAEAPEGLRFNHAMRIVTGNNFCVKCHIVADFDPGGSDQAKAPDLSRVAARLRPDFLRNWIANPKLLLPYTSMPLNIPYEADHPHLGGVDQKLYHGSSVEQVDALVDLLVYFEEYTKRRSRVAPLIKPIAPATATVDDSSDGNSE